MNGNTTIPSGIPRETRYCLPDYDEESVIPSGTPRETCYHLPDYDDESIEDVLPKAEVAGHAHPEQFDRHLQREDRHEHEVCRLQRFR